MSNVRKFVRHQPAVLTPEVEAIAGAAAVVICTIVVLGIVILVGLSL